MRPLRGLLVDDEEPTARTAQQSFDYEFDGLGLRVDWTFCDSAHKAIDAIKGSPPFDLAVIDLYLGDNEPDGLAVVRALRRAEDRTFILVITGNPVRNQAWREDAEEVGATHAIPRGLLLKTVGRWSPADVTRRVQGHLLSTGVIPAATVGYDDEPGIRSLLEAVGDGAGAGPALANGVAIVRNLAARCLPDRVGIGSHLTLSYLAPGRSGAHVCRIDVSSAGQPTESFVLKLGLDRGALERERRANAEAGRVLDPQTLVSIIGDVQVDQSGYGAIVARVADTAMPLGRWLEAHASPGEARTVARVLFGDQLRGLRQPSLRDQIPVMEWIQSSALYQARVNAMLAKFREVVRHPEAGSRRDVDRLWTVISDFVQRGLIPTQRAGPLGGHAPVTGGFGDLHSANVLVPSGPLHRPILIDASMYRTHHWALDYARLLVDVFLRVRHAGVPAMLWSAFRGDLAESGWLCPLRRSTTADTSTPTAFLDQICAEVSAARSDYPGTDFGGWHWQWHVAVAKELLRQSSSPDLTPMRAALALVAAGRHLREAALIVDAGG